MNCPRLPDTSIPGDKLFTFLYYLQDESYFCAFKTRFSLKRNRIIYALSLIATVAAGLASRRFSIHLPLWVNTYLGDALWALMVFIILGLLFRRKSSLWIACLALAFSFSIEFSQLYHAAWIDHLRHTRIGGLVLGFGFLWSDLACYTLGIGFGYGAEILMLKEKGIKE